MHHLKRRLKDVYAFKKEWPFLFEKDRKALIGRHHSLIGLDLSEIRIERGIERYSRRQVELHRQAGIKLHRLIYYASRVELHRTGRG